MQVADRVSVMRDGQMVGTKRVADTDVPDMAHMMVGREVLFDLDRTAAKPSQPVFEADHITVASASGIPAVVDLSLEVREGEILGIAGVSGNGQTELVEAITGMRPVERGSLRLLGQDITRQKVGKRRQLGMVHIPEDRIHVGLNLETSLDENLIVSRYKLPEYNRLGFLIRSAIRKFAAFVIKQFAIAAARPGGSIAALSGGNMQKVVVGRELSGEPKLIVANQPTRGLDVGSIEFVHNTLLDAREQGAAILLISVELDEIMSLSDRIAVIYRGQIAGEADPAKATEEQIGALMAGGSLAPQEKVVVAPTA